MKKKNIIIGFGSKARIGKDYAASELSKFYTVERVAFADALKDDLAVIFARSGLDLKEMLNVPATKERVRPLLVEYGQTMRKFHPDIWVDRALTGREFTSQITIVTDVRFPNEANRIKELGGYYIEIDTDIEPANETEALYSPQMAGIADFTVRNNFDGKFITDLRELMDSLLL